MLLHCASVTKTKCTDSTGATQWSTQAILPVQTGGTKHSTRSQHTCRCSFAVGHKLGVNEDLSTVLKGEKSSLKCADSLIFSKELRTRKEAVSTPFHGIPVMLLVKNKANERRLGQKRSSSQQIFQKVVHPCKLPPQYDQD